MAVISVVYQQGPKWIQAFYQARTEIYEIEYRRVAYRLLAKHKPQSSWEISALKSWFHIRGLKTQDETSLPSLAQRWYDVLFYWNSYKHPLG